MRWYRRIKRFFRKPNLRPIRPQFEKRDPLSNGQRFTVRRWDSATNNTLNANRWLYADGQSINTDLVQDLGNLQARCAHEFANNPIFEGIVNTFKNDVVGADGPKLQVLSDDERFNDEVERQWKIIFSQPDPSRPSTGGVETMKQWVHCLMTAGSFFNVFTEPRRDNASWFGWKSYHPRRLQTPTNLTCDPNVAFGIRMAEDGTPVSYYITKPIKVGGYEINGMDYQELNAYQCQHRFFEIEPEQITGYPLMASTLNTAADIRELDRAEIRAQQRAAQLSLGLHASNPEAVLDPEPIDDSSFPISDDDVNVAPLGWTWQQLDANRPSSEHIAYRRERIAEMGRPFGMPLLIILLTVSDVNFSSAQFGGMLYADTVKNLQSFLARMTLNQMVEMIIQEIVLSGKGYIRPKNYELSWTFNVPPNANIEKFVRAIRMLIEDGVISRSIAQSMFGLDPEKVDASRARDNERSDELGISRPPVNAGESLESVTAEETEEAENEEAAVKI